LRTPLTLILGPLEDLAADGSLTTGSRRKVELISKSAERLRDLINQILEFRKTETQNRRLTVAREVFKKEFGMLPSELTKGNKNEH
jgi:signal transduction histidine kinase